MERRKLSVEEVKVYLHDFRGWEVIEGQISKTYEFASYASGVMFASAVGHLADHMDHHPDMTVTYQKVRIALNTHDVGGISLIDFELARRIEAIA
ncbi:MAG: 4a-hydroxytetrahydrobiopterin dehydratase [Fimbriimonadaceae bacterium]